MARILPDSNITHEVIVTLLHRWLLVYSLAVSTLQLTLLLRIFPPGVNYQSHKYWPEGGMERKQTSTRMSSPVTMETCPQSSTQHWEQREALGPHARETEGSLEKKAEEATEPNIKEQEGEETKSQKTQHLESRGWSWARDWDGPTGF